MLEGEERVKGRREVLAVAAAAARAGESVIAWPFALTIASGGPGGTYATDGPAGASGERVG